MTEVGLWLSAVCCICFFLTKRDNQRFLQRKWSVNKIEEILFTSSCLNCWRHFWWMLSKKMAQKIKLRHKMSQRKYWQMGTQSFRESRSKAEERDLLFVHYWFWKATYWLFFCRPHCCRLLPWPSESRVTQWNATANYIFVRSQEHCILKTGTGRVQRAVSVGEGRSSVQKGSVLRHWFQGTIDRV